MKKIISGPNFDQKVSNLLKNGVTATPTPPPNPASVSDFPNIDSAPPKKGKKGKKGKGGFFADLEDELNDPEKVKELEAADIEPVLSKSQLKKQKRNQKKQAAAAIDNGLNKIKLKVDKQMFQNVKKC